MPPRLLYVGNSLDVGGSEVLGLDGRDRGRGAPGPRHPGSSTVSPADTERDGQTTATFTQWIGGSESNMHSHSSPPSRPIHSWPVVVPK